MKTNILKIDKADINFRYVLRSLLVLILYFVAGKLGLKLAFENISATAVWPPTGIAIAALLLGGYRYYPAIFLGAFLVNITTAGSVAGSLGIALGNMLEGLLGAFLMNRYAGGKRAFQKVDGVIKFTFLSTFLATTLSATVGVLSLLLTGNATLASFKSVWLTWWLGDASGALIVTPLIVLWATNRRPWRKKEAVEALVVFIILLTIGQIVFRDILPFAYLCIPVLVWAALRLTAREVSMGIFFLALIAIVNTLKGYGPFANQDTQNHSLLLVQLFMGTVAIMSLIVAAIVAERTADEEEIVEEQAEDEALLTSIGDGIIATDKEGKIVLVNKTFENLLGWKEKEVLGKRTAEFLKVQNEEGEDVPGQRRPLNVALWEKKKVTAVHYLAKKNGGKFPASLVATPVILSGKLIGAIEVFHDITKEKEIDQAKTEFVSLASHQLKTPLSTINWYVELLIKKGTENLSEKQKEYLEEVFQASSRMDSLINALLTVSRLEMETFNIVPQKISLEASLKETLDYLKPEIEEKKLKISEKYLVTEKAISSFRSDPKLIQMILQNILSNAIRYTGNGGRIEVTIKDDGRNRLLITVADNGIGIPKAEQGQIFSKLFRASNVAVIDRQGTGLGLYIVKSIINRMHGNIKFTSVENKGTTFYISLPLRSKKI